jgi:hypothetical protein
MAICEANAVFIIVTLFLFFRIEFPQHGYFRSTVRRPVECVHLLLARSYFIFSLIAVLCNNGNESCTNFNNTLYIMYKYVLAQ